MINKSILLSRCCKIAIAYITVLAFQTILLYPLHTSMDLSFWDESIYMGCGENFSLGIGTLGAISWSPGYVLLYSIFTRLFGTISSIFFIRYFLTIAVSLLVLTFLIQNLRSYLISVLLSLLWAMSSYNINAVNLVYHFGLFVFLLALIYCNNSRLISIIILLLCCFIRMDYIFILIPYSFYLTAISMQNKKMKDFLSPLNITKRIFSLGVFVILMTLLIYMVFNIDNWNMGGNRMWLAFRQHYALAQVEASRYNLNPYIDYNIVINNDFPNSHSLVDAYLMNPILFVSHVVNNLINLPKCILDIIRPIPIFNFLIIYVAFFVFISAIYIFLSGWKNFIVQAKNIIFELGDTFILCLISPLALIPGIIVYTKTEYSLILMPFILLLFGVLCIAFLKSFNHNLFMGSVLCVLIFIIFLSVLKGPKPFRYNAQRPIYGKVLKLRKIWPNTKIKLLGVGSTSYASYIDYGKCIPIEPLVTVTGGDIKSDGVNLQDMLLYYKPDAVLVNDYLLNSKNFVKSSIGILNSQRWVVYDIGNDEKIYFLKDK